MTTSLLTETLADALWRFQSEIRPLKKKAAAERNGDFFHYATIDAILKHVRVPLMTRGLYIFQTVTGDIGVTTRLVHGPSSQFIEDTAVVSVKGSMEDKGAAITQLRRYSLIAMLGLPTVDAPAPKQRTAADIIAEKRAAVVEASIPVSYFNAQ